jgi:subtilisin family serine protease
VTRLLPLVGLAVALLSLGADARPVASENHVRVVVQLRTPPLALEPAGGARLAAEQRAFEAALRARVPSARIDRRYRLVANGVALSLPTSDERRLPELPGVTDVLPSATYGPQLDASPQQIGAQALWGPQLETAGAGIKIGIIDTGIDARHPFFDPAQYRMPPGFPKGQTRFTSAKVIVARAFVPPASRVPGARAAFDGGASSHGTHVAGIAAGNHRTRADGGRVVSGIAPRAYLGNYKALVRTDDGLSPNGNSPEIVAAIEAAVRDGMDVLNLSIGEPEIEPSRDIVARALDAAGAAGVVSVVAAGNDFSELGAGTISSPGNSVRAITVAAVEVAGAPTRRVHADFSSVGPTTMSLRLKPDVAAPGVEILSSVPDDGWQSFSGTSMAAPHISGAAALLRNRHPGWTVAQIKSALVQTGVGATNDRGAALGPEFAGGGVVSLTAADRPLVFAEPSTVSFGLLEGQGWAEEHSVRLVETGGQEGAGAWRATVEYTERPPGVSIDLGTSEASTELAFEVRVAGPPRDGELAGYLVLRRGQEVRRIPFWGRRTAQRLARHRAATLRGPGTYTGTTRGRPALVTSYRYPENPRGSGIARILRGPERVFRFRLERDAANLGVLVMRRDRGVGVEPRVVTGLDENRLTGYAGLPLHHNPYLEGFRSPVPAAAALAPRAGDYYLVFDSATRAGAGRFRFRLWVNDVRPPMLRVRGRTVRRGRELLVGATDSGSGVYPASIRVRVDGAPAQYAFRGGVLRIPTARLAPGRHRLSIRVSDYQETKNTENVRRILPNTRRLSATFQVRP